MTRRRLARFLIDASGFVIGLFAALFAWLQNLR